MSEYQYLLVERDGPVGVVTLNRPEQLNALFTPLVSEMASALESLDADADIRAIVLTGGTKVFAAGADLKEMSTQSAVDALMTNRIAYWDRVKRVSKPIIAAVSGYALGGGCELAMLCDIIIASETAKFGQPEIKVGLIPGAGGTQRLTRSIGKYRAMELILTGAFIDASEAERRGLACRVVAPEVLIDEAKKIGFEIAKMPPISVRLAKEAVTKAFESTVETGIELERRSFYFLFATEDSHEGMQAFVEKRRPTYEGR
jgi:enoyl-CoA hydratase